MTGTESASDLAARIDALLPQTQCTRCGYAGCRPYAAAIASGEADINQCPPGGSAVIHALGRLLGRKFLPLNPANGVESPPRVAWIDESRCIGCARCLAPCPVDAIVGAGKYLHTVLIERCTGCELCVAPCPVDCIELRPRGSAAQNDADRNRERYQAHVARFQVRAMERRRGLAAKSVADAQRRAPAVNPAKRREIVSRLRTANPLRVPNSEYGSPFQLLIAVILSAQATDRSVNKATPALFRAAPTPAAMRDLGIEGLAPYIKTIGLFNTKAKNIIATCAALVDRHAGHVPATRDELEALPGVGRKTANVVLNTAFGAATIAVDTHIFRVANRTGLAPGNTVRSVEDKLLKFVAPEFRNDAHHWLILHGRYVCKARIPACPVCVIADLCEYRRKTRTPPP